MRNEKGEDWQKYLKEMEQLGPLLKENVERKSSGLWGANGKLEPINNKFQLTDKNGALILDAKAGKTRAERRQLKRQQKRLKKRIPIEDREYLQRMMALDKKKDWLKDAEKVSKLKESKINIWFDEELKMLIGAKKLEKIKAYINKHGKWPWWRRYIKLAVQHTVRPYPWGSDHLAIYIFGQLHASTTYKWVDK